MALIWRPGKASRGVLALVAGISLLGYLMVEGLPKKTQKPYYAEKIKAAKKMAQGMEVIKQARISIFGRVNAENDPLGTGMIGPSLPSSITSKEGILLAKQISANPNFAALMVQFYKRAGLKDGDTVALAFSGSFPSLNIAAIVAAEVLNLKPLVITSMSASQFGANDPELTWLDMEKVLFEKGIIHHRSIAASLGGQEDRGKGISPDGIQLMREDIKQNGVELIDPPDLPTSFDMRMNIYKEAAAEKPIACYVNVGGGVGSVGNTLVKHAFKPGLNKTSPHQGHLADSIMTRMSHAGIPVIHLIYVEKLAKQYGLAVHPDRFPRVGEGRIFMALGYNMLLTWGVLVGLVLVIFILLRMDLHYYILRLKNVNGTRNAKPGEQRY
jgi:poly-gamma-glutamate system protein